MIVPERFKTFRFQMLFTTLLIAIFGFGLIIHTYALSDEILQTLSRSSLADTESGAKTAAELTNANRAVFLLMVAILTLFTGLVIRLNAVFSVSLREILLGIKELGSGRLNYRIMLHRDDEFGQIADFLNGAASAIKDARAETDRVRSESLAILVHELRAPLQNIRWSAESLSSSIHAKNEMDQINDILAASITLVTLVNDILDVAKIEAGTFVVIPKDNDLKALIEKKALDFKHLADQRHLAIIVDAISVPSFRFDEVRIGQVLSNLLSNALKFTVQGEVTVSAVLNAPRKFVRVSVTDTGPGIPPDQREHLFKRFSQLATDSGKPGGTGLGLAIVKGIVTAHGGTVGIESQPGEGSTFWFELPAETTPTL